MPLVFDTGAYEETAANASIAWRDGPESKWSCGDFVPAQAILHAEGKDGRTLLSTVFAGEQDYLQLYLDTEQDGVVVAVGPAAAGFSLSAEAGAPGGAERVLVIRFGASRARDAFLARARDAAADLTAFHLTHRTGGSGAPLRRALTEVPDFDAVDPHWLRLKGTPGGLENLAVASLRAFCMHHWQHVPEKYQLLITAGTVKIKKDWIEIVIFIIIIIIGC